MSVERPSNSAAYRLAIPAISVVIPVYNGEQTLRPLVERLQAVLEGRGEPFEAILVNDGSRDGSWAMIEELAKRYPWVRGIDLMRNFGQHNALLCGIREARAPVIVTLDDDLQHPPEEIPRLLDTLAQGYDVVYGRPEHPQHGFWRNLASQATKIALQSAMGAENARNVSPFRAFRTSVREAFREYRGPFAAIDVLLTWGATRFAAVPVRHDPRQVGRSNYSFRRLVRHALNLMTGFSVVPLQLASLMGFALAGFGVLILLYVLARFFLYGHTVPGFPFLASIIAIFSGAQLLSLGIMGEYLARMHFRLMGQPTYVIARRTGESHATRDQG